MPRNARQLQTRVGAHDRGRIGVTDSTSFHPNPNLTGSGLGDWTFYYSKHAGCGDFYCFVGALHLCVSPVCISFGLNEKRSTATLMPPSILFSSHPFANICSAVLKLHAVRFAVREKAECVAIDYANVFQTQNDAAGVRLQFKKSPQLGNRLFLDSAT